MTIKRVAGQNLYQQIYTDLRLQILQGDIPAGTALPSYRFMRQKYRVNISTVEKAYALLEKNGYIERRQGSGCFALPLDNYEFYYTDNVVLDSFENGQTCAADIIDFASSAPFLRAAEAEQLITLINELAAEGPEKLFLYPSTRGAPTMIQAIRHRLARQGIAVDGESIHIVNGSQQGIDLLRKSLIRKGSVILAEDPSYIMAVNCFHRAGAQILTVPMESDGPDMEAVRNILSKTAIDFYYTMPSFHCPTNVVWSGAKRHELLSLALKHHFTIIEDDCVGELYFDGKPRTSFWQEAGSAQVIHINSFSKCLAPGMRLGYMLVPERLDRRLVLEKFNADISAPAILQEALALYMERGLYDLHLEKLRNLYRGLRSHLAEAVQHSRNLHLVYPENGGGMFLWVRLPEGIDSSKLWIRLLSQKIKLLPSVVFSRTGNWRNYVRLSYTGCTLEQMDEGLSRMDREIDLMLHEAPPESQT